MKNYIEHLYSVVERTPDKIAISRWGAEKKQVTHSLTYSQLVQQAARVGAGLSARFEPESRVLVCISEPLDFALVFLGCWCAGLIPVPVSVPGARVGDEVLRRIVARAEPVATIIGVREADRLRRVEGLPTPLSSTQVLAEEGAAIAPRTSEIAFLQFTSGSSGAPKGVVVRHANVLANEAMMRSSWRQTADDCWGSWLPLFHDMGLINGILSPWYNGCTAVLMRPIDFVTRPASWIEMISACGVTTSGAPNFAYELTARRFQNAPVEGFDLSRWRVAYNGAEPIQDRTLRAFAARFEPCGFDAKSLVPCYGMAEATLFVSGGAERTLHNLYRPVRAFKGPTADGPSKEYVSCGKPASGLTVRIVDPDRREALEDGAIGEVWLQGDSIATAYFRDPEISRETFENELGTAGHFLRTGDLGFLQNGELVITGRLKDVIPYRGRSIHAADVESAVQAAHEATMGAPCAAFEVETEDECGVAVVAEVRRELLRQHPPEMVRRACELAVLHQLEVKLAGVVLIEPGKLPLTTSGKVRRQRAREIFWSPEAAG